jgi:hypothetical protein
MSLSITPWLYGALLDGQGFVRDDQVQVDVDDSPKAPAGFARSHRTVKGKEVWDGPPVNSVAEYALELITKGKMLVRANPQIKGAAPKAEGLLQGIEDPFSLGTLEQKAINYDVDISVFRL